MNQLYALLRDDQIRYIDLADEIIEPTRELFVNAAEELIKGVTEEVEFNGNYVIREDDNEISYVTWDLPDSFSDIPDNQQGITTLDIENDDIKSLFWYEDGQILFQMFSAGNLLESKYIVKFLQEEHNFNRFTDKAFIINSKIQAIYKEGKLYFKSFPSVSKIFDLRDKMVEATTREVSEFGNSSYISIDVDWLTKRANTKTRRLIKMITESGTLKTFMEMDARKRGKIAKSVNIDIDIKNNKINMPRTLGEVNRVLEFLNEDVFKGLISSNVFRTNSKRLG